MNIDLKRDGTALTMSDIPTALVGIGVAVPVAVTDAVKMGAWSGVSDPTNEVTAARLALQT